MTRAPLTQIESAAEWAVGMRLADVPAETIELSKSQIANIIAAIIAGSASAAGQAIWRAVGPVASSGPCPVIPTGVRLALNDALYLHASWANALELDDFHFRGHLGPASVVVPLTLGGFLGSSGEEILRAQVIANELGGRLGWAITAEVRHGHQRSYLLRFSAAAAAASLLGLDVRQFATALGIAMTQPELALHPGMFSPDTKVLSAAAGVVEGTRAASLARAGITAATDILEHSAGFYRQFTMHRDVPSPFVQLGEAWCTDAMSFKRYSACAYASGCVDAALQLRRGAEFDAEAIASFEIASSLPALIMERLARPHEDGVLTPVNVQFSIIRSVAAALHHGDLRGIHFRPEVFAAAVPSIASLAERGTLTHDWHLTIEQLRGIDAGMPEVGGSSADMWQFHRTSLEFRRLFGTASALGLGDVPRLLALPHADRSYFAHRWWRSLRNNLSGVPQHDMRQVGDLSKLSWRMGGRVTVALHDGRRLSAEQVIPPGMAGDPDRHAVVHEKLLVEAGPYLTEQRADRLWHTIREIEVTTALELILLATMERGEPDAEIH